MTGQVQAGVQAVPPPEVSAHYGTNRLTFHPTGRSNLFLERAMGEQHDRPMLKIGQLARRWGLNPRTLRYYESIGLLPPHPAPGGTLPALFGGRRATAAVRAPGEGHGVQPGGDPEHHPTRPPRITV